MSHLFNTLLVAFLLCFGERLVRLLALLPAVIQGAFLEVWGLPIENVDGLDANLEHLSCTKHESSDVRGDLACIIREHVGAVWALHGDQKLIDGHGGVNGNLAPKVGVDLDFLKRQHASCVRVQQKTRMTSSLDMTWQGCPGGMVEIRNP